MGKAKKILTIDGGGVRGIIPASILAEMEKRTGRKISEIFDLIAGTSTGGILALGLVKPDNRGRPQFAASEMVELYEKESAQVFSRSLWHRILALGNIAEEKYQAEGMEKVLTRYLGETRLKEAITDVVVTAYEIERRFPFFFKSANTRFPDKKGYNFTMWEAARATSAAPTYFEPARIKARDTRDYYALVDGGVFANNPGMCALAEAKSMFPRAEDFILVSLGTGMATTPLPYDEAKKWGLARWAKPLLSVVFAGVSDTVDYQLRHLLPAGRDALPRYYRLQPRLDKASDAMDDARPVNIRMLKLAAEELIQQNDSTIDLLCEQLLK